MGSVLWFLAGVVVTVCFFRWLDRCWFWERDEELFSDGTLPDRER